VIVDLVQTTTRDGLRLDGAYQSPPAGSAPAVAVDAFCLVHGTGGNFYSSTLFDALTERLLSLGCGVLRVNTRGHDGISTAATPKGGLRQGAAYEIVDDCRHDVFAWASWLAIHAGLRVGLIGHSLGAVKCLYALAQEPNPCVACVIALSPPRLSYEWFCSSPQAADFLATCNAAQGHIERGEPGALLDVKLPLPFVITAAGYVEKYGPDERYNYLRFVGSLSCPTLVTLGSVEVENNMAFCGAPEAIEKLQGRYRQLSLETITGADHFYTAVRDDLLARVESWVRTVLPV
jgi:pimeloyl-ACP methyl ester carboxylesterase